MSNVSLFTAIKFRSEGLTCHQSLIQNVDGYFYLGGKRAEVINTSDFKSNLACLTNDKISTCRKVALIISYLSVIIPLIMVLLKVALRLSQDFILIDADYSGPIQPPQVNPISGNISGAQIVTTPTPQIVQKPQLPIARSTKIPHTGYQITENTQLTSIQNRLEPHIGRRPILSFETFHPGSFTIKIANTTTRKIQIADDSEGTLLIDGRMTDVTNPYNATIFFYELNGWLLGYIKQDGETDLISMIKPEELIGDEYSASIIIRSPAKSQAYPVSDPVVTNDPHIQAIKAKVESSIGKRDLLTYEIFSYGGINITVANSVPGKKFQISNDRRRMVLIDGHSLLFGNSPDHASYFIFEHNGIIYLYNKNNDAALGGKNDVGILKPGKDHILKKAEEIPFLK